MEKVEENTHDDRRGGGSRGGCGVWCIVIHASAQWDEWPCWVANELSSTLVQFGNEMGDPKRMLVASRFGECFALHASLCVYAVFVVARFCSDCVRVGPRGVVR